MGVLSRKSLDSCLSDAFAERSSRLRRSLGVVSLTAFGVGCTIGAGIFSLTGDIAAHQAGPAVSLAFVLASVACFFAGLCYAEFAAMVPLSGSAYSYAYVTLGELVAWLIGWSLVLEWGLSASVVAVSWSGYTQSALKDLGVYAARRARAGTVCRRRARSPESDRHLGRPAGGPGRAGLYRPAARGHAHLGCC